MRGKTYLVLLLFVSVLGLCFWGCDESNPMAAPHARWVWANSPTANTLHALYRTAAKDIWAVGDMGNIIHFDGISWHLEPNDSTEDLYDIWMIDPTQGCVIGNNGFVATYANGSWSPIHLSTKVNLRGVCFADANEGWIVGEQGTILHLVGGGAEQEACPVQSNLNCVGITTNGGNAEVWAMGDDGVILKRTDGLWSSFVSPTTKKINCIYLNTTGVGWAGCEDGVLLRYRTGLWESVNSPVGISITSVWGIDVNKAWIGDEEGETYYRPSQNWAGWELYPSPANNTIYDFCFNSPQNGWGVCKDGGIIRLE